MPRLLAIILLAFAANSAFAQSSDLLIYKRGSKTIKTFYPGSHIHFLSHNQQWITGEIKAIRNDSLFIRLMQIAMLRGPGIAIADTGYAGMMFLHIKDIYAFEKDGGFKFIGNGKLFQAGAVGYAALNVANGLLYKEEIIGRENNRRLLTAAGVFLFGKLLQWTYSPIHKLGKRHKLVYVPLAASSEGTTSN